MTRLWAGCSRFWFLAVERDISLLRNIVGSHTASYPMSKVGSWLYSVCSSCNSTYVSASLMSEPHVINKFLYYSQKIATTLPTHHQQLNTVQYKQTKCSTVSANWAQCNISKPNAVQYQQAEHSLVSANGTYHSIRKPNAAHHQQTEHSTVSVNRTQHSISKLNTVE